MAIMHSTLLYSTPKLTGIGYLGRKTNKTLIEFEQFPTTTIAPPPWGGRPRDPSAAPTFRSPNKWRLKEFPGRHLPENIF